MPVCETLNSWLILKVQRATLTWAERAFDTLAVIFCVSVVFSSLCILLILTRGTEQGFMMFKRCKGAAKALCTACQITFLMASLSGSLISVEKERTSGGSIPFSSLSQQNHSPVSLRGTFAILSFKPCFSNIQARNSNGSNDLVD